MSPARTYLTIDDPVLVAMVDEALAMRLMGAAGEHGESEMPDGMSIAPESLYDDADEVREMLRTRRVDRIANLGRAAA